MLPQVELHMCAERVYAVVAWIFALALLLLLADTILFPALEMLQLLF